MRPQIPFLAVLVLSVNIATGQETVDNPEFASWSRFPKGTSITLKAETKVAGMTTDSKITTTLVETGKEKLVLETATSVKANGMEFGTPPMKRDVTKTIKLPEGFKKENFASGKPPGTFEEGTETLKILGQQVKTKWFRFKAEVNGIKTESKLWKSDEVPGMMVKMESTVKGPVVSTTTMEIVEFKKP